MTLTVLARVQAVARTKPIEESGTHPASEDLGAVRRAARGKTKQKQTRTRREENSAQLAVEDI
eukprot:11161269-Lingulodinium_polyedra.AAC.1